jgi:hypothetical protein
MRELTFQEMELVAGGDQVKVGGKVKIQKLMPDGSVVEIEVSAEYSGTPEEAAARLAQAWATIQAAGNAVANAFGNYWDSLLYYGAKYGAGPYDINVCR